MVLLIYRAEEYSPNNVAKDKAILDAVGGRMTAAGHEVVAITEAEVNQECLKRADVTLSMARRWKSLMLIEQNCNAVVNSPSGVRITAHSRGTTMELLDSVEVKVPLYWTYEPSEDQMFVCEAELKALLPGWIKGMHPGGVTKMDVQFVTSPIEADTAVIKMAAKGYTDIIVTKHMEGKVLKCYCVYGEDGHLWMKHFFPQDEGYTKFGDEQHNQTVTADVNICEDALSEIAVRIASVLNISVFGFDAIVDPTGEITVIDVNDWPSFSRFREEAAEVIANIALVKN